MMPIPDGPVRQIQLQNGTDIIMYAVTSTSVSHIYFVLVHVLWLSVAWCTHTLFQVIQVPIANCSSRTNCTDCLGSGIPLCGWCVVENKCSKRGKCQNPVTRWIQANIDQGQCTNISVSPWQFDLDDPQIVNNSIWWSFYVPLYYTQLTLTLSQSLPPLLVGETYLCHFASGGVTFTVDAMGSGTTYICNVTGRIPPQFEGLSTGDWIYSWNIN